jgi:hypothetical protein
MKKALCLIVMLLTGCEKATDQPAPEPADTTAPASVPADSLTRDTATTGLSDAPRATPPTQFNPQQVRVGAAIGGLRVAQTTLQPSPKADTKVTGSVKFAGEAELLGSYRAHFDYPEVKEPCFWVDLQSWSKLPRAQGDTRIVWFCFENRDEAIKQLGALGSESRATIVVDNYTTHLSQSDAWDTARLVRVVRKDGQ